MIDHKAVLILFLMFLFFLFVVFGPLFTIWSLNILFGLEIPYSWQAWCAVLWLLTVHHGLKITIKKND